MKKSRICIITPRSINDSPCLEKYRDVINEPYDIIYWSKGDQDTNCGAQKRYAYSGVVPVEGGKALKLWHYYMLTRYIKRILKKNNYEKLIVYPTHMAWLIRGLLSKKYKKRYILDIRDYAGERNPIISRLTTEAVSNSRMCTITSGAYRRFLPSDVRYIISHNVQPIDSEIITNYRKRTVSDGSPIVISFIGTVRFLEQQKRMIRILGNDPRFYLKYIGRGSEALEEYCAKGNYNNVLLIGQFERSELGLFYSNTDIANNVYGNEDPALVYALSNKLYSAAMMGMPVLASPHTYTASIVCKYGIGFVFDESRPNIADELFEYMRDLDRSELCMNADRFLKRVKKDEELYKKAIQCFLMD